MKTFWIRATTALIFAIVMVGGIFGGSYSFFILMSVILLGSLYEYFAISSGSEKNNKKIWLLPALFWFFYALSFFLPQIPVGVLIGVLAFKIFSRLLFTKSTPAFAKAQVELFPVLWILLPLVLTNQIYFEKGAAFLFAVFALIWIYDTGCYLVGSLIGKNKLLERVSPKKTIEGAVGGVIFTLIFAYFFHRIPQLEVLSAPEWVALAFVITITATLGDLVESVFKRAFQVKDSGTIMPGHGGFLDRFDAYFFTVPFVSLALWVFDRLHSGGLF